LRVAAVLLGGVATAVGLAGVGSAASPCGSAGVLSTSGAAQTCTYTSTGQDTFTVPAGVSSLHVVAVGGLGGGREAHPGGFGAQVSADVPVQSGASLYVEVAGNGGPANAGTDSAPGSGGPGGSNGGGAGGNGGAATQGTGGFGGGGGGGATDLRTAPASAGLSPDPRLLVAGGGGSAANGAAGAGTGGAAGAAGTGSGGNSGGGQPGTGNGGGAGGSGELGNDGAGAGGTGQAGALGVGGAGGAGASSITGSGEVGDGGGGAGAGYNGGGGGGGGGGDGENSGGGGGGVSFVTASATGAMLATDATGVPSLTISYTPMSRSTTTTVSCASPVEINNPTNCTATVQAQGTLTGSVTFSTDSAGSFSPNVCVIPTSPALAAFSCTVSYTPSTGGVHTITATYGGDATNDPSSGSYALTVTVPPPTPAALPLPTPVVGTSAAVTATSGTVTVSCGGASSMVLGPTVLTGCTINATQGSITLTFITPQGLQTGTFSGGRFVMNQAANGSVEITLAAPAPVKTKGRGAIARVAARATRGRAPRAHLWVTVHKGRYSVRGRNSAATVRGPAKWETIDTDAGTCTVVTQGKVSVRDLHRHQSRLVRSGHSYLVTPLPSNRLVAPPQLTPDSSGTVAVSVKVPGPGRVDVLVTAWRDNLATEARLSRAALARLAGLLQPARGRFVFARADATAQHATTLQILVQPNQLGAQLVAHHRYAVTLRLWVTYTPTGGHPRSIGFYGLHLP
jgi:hypothetical protein